MLLELPQLYQVCWYIMTLLVEQPWLYIVYKLYSTCVSKTALAMHSILNIYNNVSKTALATPGLIKIWGIVQVFHPLLFLYVLLYHSTITVCSVPYQIMKFRGIFDTKLWNVIVFLYQVITCSGIFLPSYEM